MKNLEWVNGLCERVEKFIISWGTITMAVVSIINVLSRNIFHVSFSWVEEISQFSVVLVTFVGTAYAARMGLHIRMTALSDIMGYKSEGKFAVCRWNGDFPQGSRPHDQHLFREFLTHPGHAATSKIGRASCRERV